MSLAIDEDWSKVDPAQLPADYVAVIGYVSQDTTGKNITAEQVAAIHATGRAVGLVYEYDPQSAAGGAAAGTADARIAYMHAATLGAPRGVALYAAVDWQVSADQMPAVLAYAQAFQEVAAVAGYRAGIYADFAVCGYLAAHGYSGFLWQTYAWSNGQWYAPAALRQVENGVTVAGATVDRDEAMVPDWGQWEADMALESSAFGQDAGWGIYALLTGADPSNRTDKAPNWLAEQVRDIQTKLTMTPAVILSDTDRQAIIDGVAAQLGAKLDAVAAKLTAAGHALDS